MTDATNNTNTNTNNTAGEQGFFSKAWDSTKATVENHRAKIAFIGGVVALYGVAAAVNAYKVGAAEEAAASSATDGSSSM